MTRRRSRARAAFTLLEAVLALAILASVAVVCVGIRMQSLASARRMEARSTEQRDTQAIFEMLTAGILPAAEPSQDPLTRRWTGEYQGSPFILDAKRETLPNPVFRSDAKDADLLSDRIIMWRYTLQFRGRKTEFWWHK